MQRYTVSIISPATADVPPVLLVPFAPSALVSAFVDEVLLRLSRQNIPVSTDSHICTLHLDSATGAIIDFEDVIGDVIMPGDALFAVFSSAAQPAAPFVPIKESPADLLSIRVITPALAKNEKSDLEVLTISSATTVKELHNAVSDHLTLARTFATTETECNCTLAKKISDGPSSDSSCIVVHGKSKIQRLSLSLSTEVNIYAALKDNFGDDVSTTKQVTFHGAEFSPSLFDDSYKKTPVVSICAKHRHIPRHAKVDYEDGSEQQRRVLDLHTSECPISMACQDVTLKDTGIAALAVDGVIELYAVNRATTTSLGFAPGVGKSSVFRYRSHWEPSVKQSDRGIAMMLSSLRVFASNVQEMDDHSKDAIYHVFDLLTSFPPALRSLHLLIEGKTVNSMESSALSHALFGILQSYIPTEMIGTDGARLFEGSRLLFGFVLEKARSLQLSKVECEDDITVAEKLPYLGAFSIVDVLDFKTMEPAMHIVRTTDGKLEQSLFESFDDGGALSGSHLQPEPLTSIECQPDLSRIALLGGGAAAEITVFSATFLANNYRYPDGGQASSAFEANELSELDHVAALCGRNGLAVHRPSQLASAVAPCLTFDRNAHLAVYNGPQGSSMPGDETGIFRPKHGNEAMDATVVEQLIAPILCQYEADGTAVFDMLGGATVRRLQTPDEIVMFAVDCSASMRSRTDFSDVDADDVVFDPDPTAETLVEGHFFTRSEFDDVKDLLGKHESFDDMVAIVADAANAQRRRVALEVIGLVRDELSHKIVAGHVKIERLQAFFVYGSRLATTAAQSALSKAKEFWAGLKTHESSLVDFIIFRATTTHDVATRWMWYAGEEVPAGAPAGIIPSLPGHITAIPDGLQCPISHSLMEDSVTAADNFNYSRLAITQWFAIRKSSPMTGLELQDTTLRPNEGVSAAVAAWIMGTDTLSRSSRSPNSIKLTFNSRVGSFERNIDISTTTMSLYSLVFSALKARFTAFQLVKDNRTVSLHAASLRVAGLADGDHITIRLADDGDMVVSAGGTAGSRASGEMCLIKVYDMGTATNVAFSYWVKRDTPASFNSILFKYWRYRFSSGGLPTNRERQIWTNMSNSGDGLLTGNPQDSSALLARYLNRAYCTGQLHAEPLYYEAGAQDHDESERDLNSVRSSDSALVLKVYVGNVWSNKDERKAGVLSRLDVLKQMFEALINRFIAYGYKTHAGLVTFSSDARVTNNISHILENFRRATSSMVAHGDTALWDALALSLDQIQESAVKYPHAKRRIIVISDGVNTKSTTNTCEEIAWKMKAAGVAVDSVSIGSEENRDLKTLSWVLGCYSFHPTSLANALAICEMEPFLSATERPDIVLRSKATTRLSFRGSFLNARFSAKDTVVTGDHFPDRKQHESLTDEFVKLSANLSRPTTTNSGGARSTFRVARVMKEINQLAAKDNSQYDIYVSESNMCFWKVVISGPEDSPYAAGTFLLYLDMQADRYPTFAPEARFITKMLHPNINAHGRVCHPLFGRDWTTDTSMTTVLDTIYGLLFQAEVSDPVSTVATLEYHADGVEFADSVRDHVSRNALKSRAQWQAEFLGEEDMDVDA